MANILRTDIDPSQVTINNIDDFYQETQDVLNDIENIDYQNLIHFYDTKTRIFKTFSYSSQEDLLEQINTFFTNTTMGMACFVLEQEDN